MLKISIARRTANPVTHFSSLQEGTLFCLDSLDRTTIRVKTGRNAYLPLGGSEAREYSWDSNFPEDPPVLKVIELHAIVEP